MINKETTKIIEIIKSNNVFSLICHISPDGDCLGSAQALKLALNSMGKTAHIFCDGEISGDLKFLNIKLETDEQKIAQSDVVVFIDCNEVQRAGKYLSFITGKKLAAIDHHHCTKPMAQGYIDTASPSCAEMIFNTIKDLGLKIDKQIASNIYAGIVCDTTRFMRGTANTFRITAELIESGFDMEHANYNLSKLKATGQVEFYEEVIKNTKTYFNGELIILAVNKKFYNKYKDNLAMTDIYPLFYGIEGNEVIIKITEKEKDFWSVGLRANKVFEVNSIAVKLGGGGHKFSSGATFSGSFKSLIANILKFYKEEKNKK